MWYFRTGPRRLNGASVQMTCENMGKFRSSVISRSVIKDFLFYVNTVDLSSDFIETFLYINASNLQALIFNSLELKQFFSFFKKYIASCLLLKDDRFWLWCLGNRVKTLILQPVSGNSIALIEKKEQENTIQFLSIWISMSASLVYLQIKINS